MEQLADRITVLISKYLLREISETEKAELDDWIAQSPTNSHYFNTLIHDRVKLRSYLETYNQADTNRIWQLISQGIDYSHEPNRNRIWRLLAAAAILVATAISIWLLIPGGNRHDNQAAVQIIQPGDNKAVLTLANGQQINLDDANNGKLAQEGSTAISKKDSIISYQVQNVPPATTILYNRISTPKGGQYRLILPDGSMVFLNAASSIRFPTAFSDGERRVEITGEVYFEVASLRLPQKPRNRVPFIIDIMTTYGTHQGQVEVLGTHFNINAYDEEDTIRTTLLEGSVQVSTTTTNGILRTLQLTPGQQAQIVPVASAAGDSSRALILNAEPDLETIFSWKNGYIQFSNDNIETVMRQIARWYDIEVEYEGPLPKPLFFGSVSRKEDFRYVLKLLETTSGARFRINGRKIIVTK